MDKSEVRKYLLSKSGAVEETPFKMGVPVFKVGGKMFATINIGEWDGSINLKYHKDSIQALRAANKAIEPGYHMDKNHWNTLRLDKLDERTVKEMIDISYSLVAASLPSAKKKEPRGGSW